MARLPTTRPYIGSDPEVLLLSKSGTPAPASRIISKSSKTSAGLVFDNAAAEIRHKQAVCIEYGLRDMKPPIAMLHKALRDAKGRGVPKEVSFSPALEYSDRALKAEGCGEFGCDPTLVMREDGVEHNEPLINPEDSNIRTAGFHLHVGQRSGFGSYSSSKSKDVNSLMTDIEGAVRTVCMADIYLGLPGVILESPHREAARLRRLRVGYGVAGEFRQQDYGFEYRTLGPWPLVHPIWTWWAMSMIRCCWWLVCHDLDSGIMDRIPRDAVIQAINENDLDLALNLWTEAKSAAVEIHNEWNDRGDGFRRGWRRGNDAMHPELIKRLEFAFEQDGIDTYTMGRHPFKSWKEFYDHTSMCFPAFTGWLLNERGKGTKVKASAYAKKQRDRLREAWDTFSGDWSPEKSINLREAA